VAANNPKTFLPRYKLTPGKTAMLRTSSGRATHLENTNTFVARCETQKAYVENEPKGSDWQSESVSRMGLERRQISAFGFYWRRGSPPYRKTGSYIVYGQSPVYVISNQRSQENSAAGGGIGRESS
jgi:hypothetical protein